MDENLQNIEDLFHSALDDNAETPSQNVWEAVDKRLDKDNIVSIKRKYTNLKRIAALLLLLLVGFVVYDVYKTNTPYNSNRFAKNNYNDSDSQNRSPREKDKASNEKTEANVAPAKGTNNVFDNNKENTALYNSEDANKKSANEEKVKQINTHPLQKQNIAKPTGSAKDISKHQINLTANQKKKLNTKSHYRVQSINAVIAEDKQLLMQDTNEQVNNQIPLLRKLSAVPIERLKYETKNFIDTKKILQPISTVKTKIPGTNKTAVAKNIQKKQGKQSRFSITPFFSPDIAWYRLQDDKVGNQQDNANELEKEEKHEFSYTFGALADYKINRHWGLQSGVTLSNINIAVQPKTIYAQPDNTGSIKYRINSSSGYGYVLPSYIINPSIGDSLYAFTSTHSIQYVDIPLAVTYCFTKDKFNLNAMAGLSVNILTSAKLETSVENGFDNSYEKINKLQGLRKTYFSGIAGIGADYKLTKKTTITLAPTVRFALNSINKEATVKSYPMSFGFAVGLKFGL